MANFGWSYPPGVSGREYAIAGPDYEKEIDEPCPECGEEEVLIEQGYRKERWVTCSSCGYTEDLPYPDKYDTDEQV